MLIFVLDPFPLLSEMFTMLIHRVQPQTRVFTANSFRQFNELLNKYEAPDFLIIDPYCMEFLGAIALKNVSERLPNSKIIVATNSDMKTNLEIFNTDGSIKFYHIDKKDSIRNIINYLNNTIKNQHENSEEVDQPQIIKLSKRQKQLIHCLAEGYSNEKIAEELKITTNTVKVHFYRLYQLLGTKSRLETIKLVRANGWIFNSF